MKVCIVVAVDNNYAIGKDNRLLWRLPNDLKFFKKITEGNTVVMGRMTYESIGKPLVNRRNIVISQNQGLIIEGCVVCNSIEAALEMCKGEEEIFVIGGGKIYSQFLKYADTIYLTQVHTSVPDADTFFPRLESKEWNKKVLEENKADEKHAFDYDFIKFTRKT